MLNSTNYDVVILGTGPAGLQAAIHAARKKVSVLVLGKETKSSLFHAHVENFCCLFNVTGEDMLSVGRQQAVSFGAEMLEEDVLKVGPDGAFFKIVTESRLELQSKALIVATGTTRNKLETNVAGVFAAGDICGPPWQMAKAMGEGCVAGIGAAGYAKKAGKGASTWPVK